jgi:Smg protein
MFEVLNFVYENYWHGDACPEFPVLQRQLQQVGFDSVEIADALVWIEELKFAAQAFPPQSPAAGNSPGLLFPSPSTTRLFSAAEQAQLDQASWGFLIFLMSSGALPAMRLELVMERVMATTTGAPIGLDAIKLIVLMVFWSLGEEPDALVLDELCDNRSTRTGH